MTVTQRHQSDTQRQQSIVLSTRAPRTSVTVALSNLRNLLYPPTSGDVEASMPSEGEEGAATNSVEISWREALLLDPPLFALDMDPRLLVRRPPLRHRVVVDLPSVYVLGRRHVDETLWELKDDIELTIRSWCSPDSIPPLPPRRTLCNY